MEKDDRDKEPKSKAKVARQSWEATHHGLQSRYGSDAKLVLLENYVTGKQLEAGRDIVKVLEQDWNKGGMGLSFKEIKDKCGDMKHVRRTTEEALRKLRRENICNNTKRFISKKRTLRPRKGKSKKDNEPKQASMAGIWKITWSAYKSSHKHFSEQGEEFRQELLKTRSDEKVYLGYGGGEDGD